MLDAAEKGKADPSSIPQLAHRAGRRHAVREAVGPHARVHRDGGGHPRRTPDLRAARGGRPRRARVGRRRRPHVRRLLLGDRGARVRPRHAGGDGGGRRRPGRQPAVRPRAPHARPSPTSSRCASCSARSRAAGSPTSATATTSPRRSPTRPRSPASSSRSPRRRATSSTTSPSNGSATSAARVELVDDPVRRGRRRRRGLHRRVDVDGPGGGVPASGSPRSPGSPSTTR